MDRAFEVKGYLEQQGIDGNRIRAKGYGETKPVADNSTPEGRAKNRRTDFVVTKM
jgi:outer membrane protein OmpA-like peptidoglycan-associated protein